MEKLALLSVSDKRGLVEFATALVKQHGFRLLSTGGTAKLLADAGLPTEAIEAFEALLADEIRVLGPDHPNTLRTRRSLASWLERGQEESS